MAHTLSHNRDWNAVFIPGGALLFSLVVLLIIKYHPENNPPSSASKRHGLPPQAPLKASDHIKDGKHHLLLAATGSVATIKIPNIIEALSKHENLSIRLLLTASAAEFLQGQSPEQPHLSTIAAMPNVDGIHLDVDEWSTPWVRGAPILHIELRRWADLMLIAPCSANALAKISLGLSDNLMYSVIRAWDTTGLIDKPRPGIPLPYSEGTKKGIMIAPAMNTAMWNHPVTERGMKVLEEEWGVQRGGWVEVLRPVEKDLACGDVGGGAMREWREIVGFVEERLRLGRDGEDLMQVKS